MRTAEIVRTTNETDIRLTLALDGAGKSEIATGCGFLDHMLTLFAKHGRFDLSVKELILGFLWDLGPLSIYLCLSLSLYLDVDPGDALRQFNEVCQDTL